MTRPRLLLGVGAAVLGLAAVCAPALWPVDDPSAALQAAREASEQRYIALDHGLTRYTVNGPDDGVVVVLIHSFNGFLESWRPNARPLVNAGFRVVTYDLWGRGLSARPDIDLTPAVFRRQLSGLMDHLEIDRAHLVGASFGCVIAADFAVQEPSRVQNLVLIGPSGWPTDDDATDTLLNLPVVADVLFHYAGKRILRPKVEAYLREPEDHRWALRTWQRYAEIPGFTRAALSTLRHSPVVDNIDGWRALGELGTPTLFIWGKDDVSFPYSNARKLPALIPQAELLGINDAAHWVNIEAAGQVNESMRGFLGNIETPELGDAYVNDDPDSN